MIKLNSIVKLKKKNIISKILKCPTLPKMSIKVGKTSKFPFIIETAVAFKIEQKGMTFDHDFGYLFPLYSFLLTSKREEEKDNELSKIVIKGHAFLLDRPLKHPKS